MNIQQIENLIASVTESGVSEVKITMKTVQITVKNAKSLNYVGSSIYQPNLVSSSGIQPGEVVLAENTEQDADNYVVVKSPNIGTFYLESSPGKPHFVEVEQAINKGELLCVIESMKLFNEVKAELSGTIVKILVDNSSPVEYDQPLFLINPLSNVEVANH